MNYVMAFHAQEQLDSEVEGLGALVVSCIILLVIIIGVVLTLW